MGKTMSTAIEHGGGFLHPNMPTAIDYTPGVTVNAQDIRGNQPTSRAAAVRLPYYMEDYRLCLRKSCREIMQQKNFDADDDVELCPTDQYPARTEASLGNQMRAAVGLPVTLQGMSIASSHLTSGKATFVRYDFDGVMAVGFTPQIVQDSEKLEKEKEEEKYVVHPWNLNAEEKVAFATLVKMFRSSSSSNSTAGQALRKATGGEMPDGSSLHYHQPGVRKRGRGDETEDQKVEVSHNLVDDLSDLLPGFEGLF